MKVQALLALLLAGCAASPDGRADHAPIPYTAAEIRDAHPPGTVVIFRDELAGVPAFLKHMGFEAGPSSAQVQIEIATTQLTGDPLGEPMTSIATWEDLRNHARFPIATTTRKEARRKVHAGTYDCWLYVVEEVDERGAVTHRFWFATEKPGPPVRMESERDGVIEYQSELVEHVSP